jgi:predicted RNA binding protein YcfA (HicA-like mRNA interferase family)
MPKLPRLTARKAISFLRARGFLLDHTTGSHFVFYNTRTKSRAVVPRHPGDLPIGTLFAMLREAGFSRQDMIDFFKK